MPVVTTPQEKRMAMDWFMSWDGKCMFFNVFYGMVNVHTIHE